MLILSRKIDEHSLYLCLLCLLGVCGGSFGLRLKVEWKEDDRVKNGINIHNKRKTLTVLVEEEPRLDLENESEIILFKTTRNEKKKL